MPPMPFEPEEDYIGGGVSDALFGATIDYTYSRGNHYQLIFDHDNHVTFHYLNAPGVTEDSDHFQAPQLVYRARALRDGQYLVHWIVKPANIHVSLVVDLTEMTVTVAAMMPPNKWEFFDRATIDTVEYA